MMNKIILLTIPILHTINAFACDVCNVYEYANRTNKSYVGVFYRNRIFNGYAVMGQKHEYFINSQSSKSARTAHEPEGYGLMVDRSKFDYERYQTIELRANYVFRKKWNLTIFAPYVINEIHYQRVYQSPQPIKDTTMRISGLGDMIIGGEYVMRKEGDLFKHYVKPGLAVKLPTAPYAQQIQENIMLPQELQRGSGSWDIILRGNYTITFKNNLGLENSASYKFTTASPKGYKFGNRVNFMTNLFYVFTPKQGIVRFIPKVGIYYEQAQSDKQSRTEIAGTGGYSAFYNGGIDINIKMITFQFLYQKIMNEKLHGNVVGNAGRLQIGALYNF